MGTENENVYSNILMDKMYHVSGIIFFFFRILEKVQAQHKKFGYIYKIPVSKKDCVKVSSLPD